MTCRTTLFPVLLAIQLSPAVLRTGRYTSGGVDSAQLYSIF
jgi:hypothetical protein